MKWSIKAIRKKKFETKKNDEQFFYAIVHMFVNVQSVAPVV